jgi:hypothetical protein
MRRVGPWLAIVAMALQALWPLIAQARPANLVPVCTVGGVTHYIEVPGGTQPADSQHEHCAFCLVAAALPTQAVSQTFDGFSFPAPVTKSFESIVFSVVGADARAPPVFLSVDSNHDNRRTHEEAFAFRAARAHLGGSVLRLGVLHG